MKSQERSSLTSRTLDIWLWGFMLILSAATIAALAQLPFAARDPQWVVPALGTSGILWGAFAAWRVPMMTRQLLLVLTSRLLGGALVESLLVYFVVRHSDWQTVILHAFVVTLVACLVWFIWSAQPLLALVPVWLTLAGVTTLHRAALEITWDPFFVVSVPSTWWIPLLLVLSLLILSLSHLRASMKGWERRKLQQVNAVTWSSLRSALLISVLIPLVALLPIAPQRITLLHAFWEHSPLAQGGPLNYNSPFGGPISDLGAPLGLDAQVQTNHTVLLHYTLDGSSLDQRPLLIGATMDAYSNGTWGQSANIVSSASKLTAPPNSTIMRLHISLQAGVRSSSNLLLGLGQPIGFDIGAHPVSMVQGQPTILTTAGWQANQPISGQYTATSAILPQDLTTSETLDPALLAPMTTLPAADTVLLQQTARAWIGTASTPVAQANALLQTFQQKMTLAPDDTPTGDPIAWSINQKRGNIVLLTTTYILLARALGLPVRMAEGYQGGTYDRVTNSFVVHDDDATIWAQLAIPAVGWLNLLPVAHIQKIVVPQHKTGNKPPTTHKTPTAVPPIASTQIGGSIKQALPPLLSSISIGVVLLLSLIAGVMLVQWRRFGRHLGPLVRILARLGLLARWAGVPLKASDTPRQATAKVVQHTLTEQPAIVALNSAYEEAIYGRNGQRNSLEELMQTWKNVRLALVRLIATRFFTRKDQ